MARQKAQLSLQKILKKTFLKKSVIRYPKAAKGLIAEITISAIKLSNDIKTFPLLNIDLKQ